MFRFSMIGAVVLVACGGQADPPSAMMPDASAALDAGTTPDTGAAMDAGRGTDVGMVADSGAPDSGLPAFEGPVNVDLNAAIPRQLSEYRLLRHEGRGKFSYNDRVVPYDLNAPLFSDYAKKARAIYLPPGTAIDYVAEGAFDLPVGSVVIKTFMIEANQTADDPMDTDVTVVETRVLIRFPDDWRPFPYVWRADGSDADLRLGGQTRDFEFTDPFGKPRLSRYLVPSRNQCFECHELVEDDEERTTLIGPQARQLNRDYPYASGAENQLEHLARLGMLNGLPPVASIERAYDARGLVPTSTLSMTSEAIAVAARDYLDMNCAHCHRPDARRGITSQLFLNFDNEDQFRLGVCKQPGSAGRGTGGRPYNIVPGAPDRSIMVYRTETEVVGDMMPLISRSLTDDVGAALVRAWVEQLDGDPCE